MRAGFRRSRWFVVRTKIWPSAFPTPSSALSSPEKVSGESCSSFCRSLPNTASMSSNTRSDFRGAWFTAARRESSVIRGWDRCTWQMLYSRCPASACTSDVFPVPGGPWKRYPRLCWMPCCRYHWRASGPTNSSTSSRSRARMSALSMTLLSGRTGQMTRACQNWLFAFHSKTLVKPAWTRSLASTSSWQNWPSTCCLLFGAKRTRLVKISTPTLEPTGWPWAWWSAYSSWPSQRKGNTPKPIVVSCISGASVVSTSRTVSLPTAAGLYRNECTSPLVAM
mmetsp:Transcript_103203/g.292285  ORF Transcript_103203/g.292285 Transcript_103203/m.292285 type:complete len:280 (-) Transcript_103203:217-1056(-)